MKILEIILLGFLALCVVEVAGTLSQLCKGVKKLEDDKTKSNKGDTTRYNGEYVGHAANADELYDCLIFKKNVIGDRKTVPVIAWKESMGRVCFTEGTVLYSFPYGDEEAVLVEFDYNEVLKQIYDTDIRFHLEEKRKEQKENENKNED